MAGVGVGVGVGEGELWTEETVAVEIPITSKIINKKPTCFSFMAVSSIYHFLFVSDKTTKKN